MSNIFDFDASVADGWAAFRDDLETRLTALQAPDTVRFTVPTGEQSGTGPTATFVITASDEVRCHVSPTLFGQDRDLNDDELQLLMDLEWDSISVDECVVERGRDEVRHVALAATVVMQELWQALHPTFLTSVSEQAVEPIQRIGLQASSPSQLQNLVDAAIGRMTGSAPKKDDDGDIVFTVNDVTSWLHVDGNDPVVELFANLAVSVHDSGAASAAIMDFSHHWPDIKFILIDQHVRVSIRMDATVITDAVLRSTLIRWFDFLTDGSDQVIAAVAESATEDEGTAEDLPPGLMCLLQLDDDENGPLSPREVARICGFDRDEILRLLRVSEEQRFAWRSSISEALEREDQKEAAACEHEEKAWLKTVRSLRAALRFVVLPSLLDEVGLAPQSARPQPE